MIAGDENRGVGFPYWHVYDVKVQGHEFGFTSWMNRKFENIISSRTFFPCPSSLSPIFDWAIFLLFDEAERLSLSLFHFTLFHSLLQWNHCTPFFSNLSLLSFLFQWGFLLFDILSFAGLLLQNFSPDTERIVDDDFESIFLSFLISASLRCHLISLHTHSLSSPATSSFFFTPSSLLHSLTYALITGRKKSQWETIFNVRDFRTQDVSSCNHYFF